MAKQKDVSAFFANVFQKYDADGGTVQRDVASGYTKSMPIAPVQSNVVDAPSYEMYPEKRAMEKAQREQEQQKEFKRFLCSLSDVEMENLVSLAKDRVLINKSVLEDLGSRGETLDTERLEQNGLIKRSYLADEKIFEFSLTGLGRRVLRDLGYSK